MKRYLYLLLLPLLACAEASDEAPAVEERPHNVRVLELQASDLEEYLQVSGPILAVRGVDISSEEDGVVRSVPIDKGAVVRRGQSIVELDRSLLKAQMEAAEAAKVLREYNLDRTQKLFDENSTSGQDLLIARTEFEQASKNFDVAQLRYRRASIAAPFDGMLAERMVEIGQLISAGTVVARLVDPFEVKLAGWLTERDIAFAQPGAPALVVVEGSDTPVPAELAFVGIEADPRTGKFPIELHIDNRGLKLRPGVVGRARIAKRLHSQKLVIPRDAIVEGPQGPQVFVAVGEHAEARPITLGADQGLMVICETGLAAGEELIVRGQRSLAPQSPIAIQERATRRDGWMPSDAPELREAELVSPREFQSAPVPLGG